MDRAIGVVVVGAVIVLALIVARYVIRILHNSDQLLLQKAEGHRLNNLQIQRELDADVTKKGAGFHGH